MTGSLGASLVAGAVFVSMLAILILRLREPRWLVARTTLVTVLILLGTTAYGALWPGGEEGHGGSEPSLHARWSAAIEAVTDSPLSGVGRGATAREAVGIDDTPVGRTTSFLQFAAETGLFGGLLLLALLWWMLSWVAKPGWRRGSSLVGVVMAGSIALACFQPIWHAPAVPLTLATLAGAASLLGGDASWRLALLWQRITATREPAPR